MEDENKEVKSEVTTPENKTPTGESKEEVKINDKPVETSAPKEDSKKVEDSEDSASSASPDVSKDVVVPKEFKEIVEKIEKMTVMELHSLVKLLEAKFDVSAQASAVAVPAQGGESEGNEQSTFTVELKSGGDSKIAVIKAVKAALGLGLKEAKDLVDGAPSVLKEGTKKEEAEELKKAIEEAGGSIELK